MKPYHKNPRQITGQQYTDLEKWLDELGDLSGIVHDLNSDEIPAGNQRSRVFGIIKDQGHIVITEQLDEPTRQGTVARGYIEWHGEQYAYRQVRWTPRQCEAANVIANRSGGEWDWDILANEFEIDDLLDWGFEEAELGLKGFDLGGDGVEDPGAQVDKAAELQEKWQVCRGQIWEIGVHRLMCGDSTVAEDVERLMGGVDGVKLFATDPPYGCNAGNIGFTAQRDDIEAITKDDLEGREMQAFLESVFCVWLPYLAKDCAWYLWHPMLTQGYFAAAAAAAADLIIHRQIIWRKEQFIFGRGDYHWRHELCFYGWRQGNRPQFYGERNQDTIWDIPWGEKRSVVGHPTAKPIELFAIPMRNHTRQGEICAEPFAGSGSQLVACEQTGRIGYGMEIEPKYCAVTLERMTGMGLQPKLTES